VANLVGVQLGENQLQFFDRGCPHHPTGLPQGKMGIYIFEYNKDFLKIGKVGHRSGPRFLSQHYNPRSSRSNLAKSILNDNEMARLNLNEMTVGPWIRQNIHRYDVLLDASLGVFVLNLFEAFLQCRFHPKYEGYEEQRK
jgi:hypothetical protein